MVGVEKVLIVFVDETDGRQSTCADGVGSLVHLDESLARDFFCDVLDVLVTSVAVEEMLSLKWPLFFIGVDSCGHFFTDSRDTADGRESRDANGVRILMGLDALLAGREKM